MDETKLAERPQAQEQGGGESATKKLQKILSADRPMTLAGAPAGFLPWLAADLARAAKGRAVFIAPDEAAMRALADAANYFAPELEVLAFPAWDCLPYDRASPSLRSTAERLATCMRCSASAEKPQLLVTTVNAATQRTLTPFRIRQLVARLAPGERIDLDRLATLLQANGYHRTDTVARCRRIRGARRHRRSLPVGRDRGPAPRFLRRRDRERPPLRSRRPAHHRRRARRLHPPPRVRGLARRGQHQALPLALSREVRRHRDRRPALSGGVGRPPPRRHRSLAAVVRGTAGNALRPSLG